MFFWTCLEYLAATLGLPGHAISCLNDTVNGRSRITRRSQGWLFVLAWTINISTEMRLLPGSYRCNTRVAQIALHAICLLGLVAVVLVVVVVVFMYRVYITTGCTLRLLTKNRHSCISLQISASYTAKKKHRDQRQPISYMSVFVTSRRHQQVARESCSLILCKIRSEITPSQQLVPRRSCLFIHFTYNNYAL